MLRQHPILFCCENSKGYCRSFGAASLPGSWPRIPRSISDAYPVGSWARFTGILYQIIVNPAPHGTPYKMIP